ncbi:MAG: dTDP-glucose 4,6-dehydratase [Pseudobdellovibrionaceae bacterium]|jgi:dTDP-glucose 4,6-dehydratase|nr:dTDP-glucose 4,6-dehydratase [Pseudobdellovibrionaceae bacterium]
MTILITGGAGFIGSNFVRHWLSNEKTGLGPGHKLVILDKLTYAGHLRSIEDCLADKDVEFVHGDIGDRGLVLSILQRSSPEYVINFAAESHVDRSINKPGNFIETNILSTHTLLSTVLDWWENCTDALKEQFRFLHISTDEVYGSLQEDEPAFTEENPYKPNSPYSASKASSDHLVRAYHHTYGLPVLTTNCSNNYGPYQFPEKLIPLMICNAIAGKELPVYGDGKNIRDWLYVGDHCTAICEVLKRGKVGDVYNIGGGNEIRNIDIVQLICKILDDIKPRADGKPYSAQITFVEDRKGHDKRYAINSSKIRTELGWRAEQDFSVRMRETVKWYLANEDWIKSVLSEE